MRLTLDGPSVNDSFYYELRKTLVMDMKLIILFTAMTDDNLSSINSFLLSLFTRFKFLIQFDRRLKYHKDTSITKKDSCIEV